MTDDQFTRVQKMLTGGLVGIMFAILFGATGIIYAIQWAARSGACQ
jgi:hypothetical protein